MEEKILNILKEKNEALTVYEIEDILGINDVKGLRELLKVLNELEASYKIYRTKRDMHLLILKVTKMFSLVKII